MAVFFGWKLGCILAFNVCIYGGIHELCDMYLCFVEFGDVLLIEILVSLLTITDFFLLEGVSFASV